MELRKPLFVLAVLWGTGVLMLFSNAAQAELRCDCTQVVDTCSATVSLEDMRVSIDSDSDACSRVDYLIDGQPFAALVVGGATQLNWPGQPLRDPSIVVENCRVCAENGSTAAAATSSGTETDASPAAADTGKPQPIVKIMPTYPRDAWTNNIEGTVTVSFNVNENGTVEKIKVVNSSNPIFVNNSIDAISRFRYAPARKDGAAIASQGLQEQFIFRIVGQTNPIVSSTTP